MMRLTASPENVLPRLNGSGTYACRHMIAHMYTSYCQTGPSGLGRGWEAGEIFLIFLLGGLLTGVLPIPTCSPIGLVSKRAVGVVEPFPATSSLAWGPSCVLKEAFVVWAASIGFGRLRGAVGRVTSPACPARTHLWHEFNLFVYVLPT